MDNALLWNLCIWCTYASIAGKSTYNKTRLKRTLLKDLVFPFKFWAFRTQWSSQFFTLHTGGGTKSCLISFSSALSFSWVSSCKVSVSGSDFSADPWSKVHPTGSSCFNTQLQGPPGFSMSMWGLLCLNPSDTGRGAVSQNPAGLRLVMKCQVSTFTMPGWSSMLMLAI